MRIILGLLFALFAVPAFAQGSTLYENGRFGYSVAIPPAFSGLGESDNGDGQEFAADGRASNLLVWGANIIEPDFESEVAAGIGYSEQDAWNVTGQTVTPRWASFSGIKGFRILQQRLILLCDGTSYAAFRLEYSVTESSEMEPVIDKLTNSLRASGC